MTPRELAEPYDLVKFASKYLGIKFSPAQKLVIKILKDNKGKRLRIDGRRGFWTYDR